jgi:hypothetical protein
MNSAQLALVVALITTDPVPEFRAAAGEPGADERNETANRYLCDVRAQLGFGRADFEALVLNAWLDGLIELSRADLVFDADKVEDSEIRYLTETFHYAAPCAG